MRYQAGADYGFPSAETFLWRRSQDEGVSLDPSFGHASGPETFKRARVGSDWIQSKGGRMRLRHNTCQTTADFNELQTF